MQRRSQFQNNSPRFIGGRDADI